MPKFNRQRLVFGLHQLMLIEVAELAASDLQVPAWPRPSRSPSFWPSTWTPGDRRFPRGRVCGITCGVPGIVRLMSARVTVNQAG